MDNIDFNKIFDFGESQIEYFKNTISKINDNPEIVLTDIFDNDIYNFLTDIVKREKTYSLSDLQNYLYSKIETLDIFKEFNLVYEEHNYISKINIVYKGKLIGRLNIYAKTLELTHIKEHHKFINMSNYKEIAMESSENRIKTIENNPTWDFTFSGILKSKRTIFSKIHLFACKKKYINLRNLQLTKERQYFDKISKEYEETKKKEIMDKEIWEEIFEIQVPKLIGYFEKLKYNCFNEKEYTKEKKEDC